MPQGFGDIMASIAPFAGAGSAGMGLIGNILSGIQTSQQLNKVKAIEKMSPQTLGSMVSKAAQPINAGLQQGVDNIVQADLASRGLAQAPGIFATEESQALAPYFQQNIQTALSLISQKLGLPVQTLATMLGGRGMPFADISSLFKMLTGGMGGPGGPGGAGGPGWPYGTPPFLPGAVGYPGKGGNYNVPGYSDGGGIGDYGGFATPESIPYTPRDFNPFMGNASTMDIWPDLTESLPFTGNYSGGVGSL